MSMREKIGVSESCWEALVFLIGIALAISLAAAAIGIPFAWYHVRKIEVMAEQGYEEAPLLPGNPNSGTYLKKVTKP